MNTSTQPKTVLITGASRGIGAACAASFAAAGYNLVLTCNKSMDDLQAICTRLTAQYDTKCLCVQADMGCEEDVLRLFSQIDKLDVLVNNAGMAHFGLLSDMTADEWHRIFAVNIRRCKLFLRRGWQASMPEPNNVSVKERHRTLLDASRHRYRGPS